MKKQYQLACFLMVLTAGGLGCDQPKNTAKVPAPPSHSHPAGHKHAETLAEALNQISDTYATIKTAFEKGTPDSAHDAMHDVGHVLLEDVPELLTKSSLDNEVKGKIAAGMKTIADAFGKLDDGYFHGGGEKVDFADMDKVIAPALEELKGLIK